MFRAGSKKGGYASTLALSRAFLAWTPLEVFATKNTSPTAVAMGSGRERDGQVVKKEASRVSKRIEKLKSLPGNVRDDLVVLRHMWFSKAKGGDHAARLESFYGPQASACEHRDVRCAPSVPPTAQILIRAPTSLQMTSSVPTSYGAASPCLPPAQPGSSAGPTWSGSTWGEAPG